MFTIFLSIFRHGYFFAFMAVILFFVLTISVNN